VPFKKERKKTKQQKKTNKQKTWQNEQFHFACS
jgi:hypothetical protein